MYHYSDCKGNLAVGCALPIEAPIPYPAFINATHNGDITSFVHLAHILLQVTTDKLPNTRTRGRIAGRLFQPNYSNNSWFTWTEATVWKERPSQVVSVWDGIQTLRPHSGSQAHILYWNVHIKVFICFQPSESYNGIFFVFHVSQHRAALILIVSYLHSEKKKMSSGSFMEYACVSRWFHTST